jgi:hypothetical protein
MGALSSQIATAKPMAVVKADCRSQVTAKNLTLKACLSGKQQEKLSLTIGRKDRDELVLEQDIDPQGTFDQRVSLLGANDAYLAYAYDDTECVVVKLVDLATGKVVADSGCRNSRYCDLEKIPVKGGCRGEFTCGDGGKGVSRLPFTLCEASKAAPAR